MSINIRDANEVNLLTGATLTAGADTEGTAVALDADATNVTFVLTLNTTGTTVSTVEVQVSSDDFSSDIRSLGAFAPIDAATADGEVRYFDAFIPGVPGEPGTSQLLQGARYVRAHVVTGASAVLTGSTLYGRIAGYGRNDPTRTA